MTLRYYLILMGLGTALAWGTVALIVTMVDPASTQVVVFGVFYASLFMALTGTFSIMGFASRVVVLRKYDLIARQVAISFRQAVMLALLIVVALFLQGRSLLTWWNALLLVALLTVLESFFVTARASRA